jgi:hypothetical protein
MPVPVLLFTPEAARIVCIYNRNMNCPSKNLPVLLETTLKGRELVFSVYCLCVREFTRRGSLLSIKSNISV